MKTTVRIGGLAHGSVNGGVGWVQLRELHDARRAFMELCNDGRIEIDDNLDSALRVFLAFLEGEVDYEDDE